MTQWSRIYLTIQEMEETQIPSLGWEGPLLEEMESTPVFLPGESMDRGTWRATVGVVAELDTTEHTRTHMPQIRGIEEYWTDPGNSSPSRLDKVATVGGIKSR